MNKNIISIIDGATGSCGKAKVVGEITTDTIKIGAAVTNCMTNAGHTFVDENGSAIIWKFLKKNMKELPNVLVK